MSQPLQKMYEALKASYNDIKASLEEIASDVGEVHAILGDLSAILGDLEAFISGDMTRFRIEVFKYDKDTGDIEYIILSKFIHAVIKAKVDTPMSQVFGEFFNNTAVFGEALQLFVDRLGAVVRSIARFVDVALDVNRLEEKFNQVSQFLNDVARVCSGS